MINFDDIYRKNQKEENTSQSNDLDLDSLLKLASKFTNQDTLFDKLSKAGVASDSNEVDISSIVEDISQAASHTFAGIENELSGIKAELEKLNKNVEILIEKE
ncbi:hypothetical protein [Halobacillus sp. H74]|uniref:hypothetical protein n=1 Tax=Halobacillus sp. H74 TaxID=3457436 RepID=UPI003FCD27D1